MLYAIAMGQIITGAEHVHCSVTSKIVLAATVEKEKNNIN